MGRRLRLGLVLAGAGLLATGAAVSGASRLEHPRRWTVPVAVGACAAVAVLAALALPRPGPDDGDGPDRGALPIGPPAPCHDERPADGEVGRVEVFGVRGEPNPEATGYRRYLGLDPESPGPSPHRGRREWGRRFPTLLGRVAIVSVFLGRDGRGWSDPEIAGAHRALERAGRWLEREAIRWRVPMNVDLADAYFVAVEEDADLEVAIFRADEYGEVGLPDPDAEVRLIRLLASASARLGFADPVDLLGRVGRRIAADRVVWLVHVRRAGQSIALPSDATGLPGVAVAACYAREEDVEEPLAGPPYADPITFVHELMHLFGATDKYDVPLSRFPRGTVSGHDVMVIGLETLSQLRVDPLTAFEIGWAASDAERPTGPTVKLRGR